MMPQLDIKVVRQELSSIQERRRSVFPKVVRPQAAFAGGIDIADGAVDLDAVVRGAAASMPPSAFSEAAVAPGADEDEALRQPQLTNDFRETHATKPFGVAFSGGGIRSATFNLGVLQGLAERGLLKYVDYLSTVSGGGYIGAWLHGVVRNCCDGDVQAAERVLSPATNPVPGSSQHDPVTYLRSYSNYLAPRPGLFSVDTWVIASIWIRNVLLNQLILAPTIAAGVVLILIAGFVQQKGQQVQSEDAKLIVLTLVALAALGVAVFITKRELGESRIRTFTNAHQKRAQPAASEAEEERTYTRLMAPLVFVASVILACGGFEQKPRATLILLGAGVLALFVMFQLTGGFVECHRQLRTGHAGGAGKDRARVWVPYLHIAWMAPLSAAVTIGLVFAAWQWVLPHDRSVAAEWQRLAFGPPVASIALTSGATLLIGLMGADYPDAAREWLGRVGAVLGMICAGWMAVFLIAVFGVFWLASLALRYLGTAMTLAGGWILTTAGGILVGRRPMATEPSAERPRVSLRIVAAVAPAVFMVGYLLIAAFAVHLAFAGLTMPSAVRFPDSIVVFRDYYWGVLELRGDLPMLAALLALCLVVALIAAARVNVNEFSMHQFYKNRLVRCYLGASHCRDRRPNVATGFDPKDDFALSGLTPDQGYAGPYAIVNGALNLNADSELAKQERKAESFVFTPMFCGFQNSRSKREVPGAPSPAGARRSGFRKTKGFTSSVGPSLGTAIAISGAAASPNSGARTSGPMAFLLTVFDARLGYWLGNPQDARASRRSGPGFAWLYLFAELFARTTARDHYVNVSDGGHYENLGLYELVRRRCRYIIVGDAEQDPQMLFDGLGGVIRKCRADFGVEIDLDPDRIRRTNGASRTHCVVGTIKYPENECGPFAGLSEGEFDGGDRNARGWILYLKSSLTGDEPADVLEYHAEHPEFPHQSTADQFFSESQFESYRRLGLHVVRDAFDGIPLPANSGAQSELREQFQQLTQKWYAPIRVADDSASRLAGDYTELIRSLAGNAALTPLGKELLPELPHRAVDTSQLAFTLETIQLMENVYTEFGFEHASNRANPRNAGWMNVFRRWASSDQFRAIWRQVSTDYQPLFRRFVEDLHAEDAGSWPDRR